ncbi:MAG: glycosyltransferase family 61 protein [Holophagaceae bacterium]|nr:glycosyltransferase family 61 protein [Holophagaceae bacterium]
MRDDVEKYAESRQFVKEGKAQEAYQMVLDLILKGTSLWEPYYEAAIFSFYNNDYKTALGFFRMAARKEKITFVSTLDLTNLLMMMGNYSEALDIWKNKLSGPHAPNVLEAFMEFLSGMTEPSKRAEDFFKSRVGGPKIEYPEFCQLMRQSVLPQQVQITPREEIQPTRVQYFNMEAPAAPATFFPALSMFNVSGAVVSPYSDTVIMGDKGIIPDYFNLEEHLFYDTFTRRSIPMAGGDLLLVSKDVVLGHLKTGVILTSYAISNWAHFLTEIMPIVSLVEELMIPTHVPLLISKPFAEQTIQFLNLVKSPGRPIEIISSKTLVDEAIWFTPTTTVPFEYLKSRCGKPVHYSPSDLLFSPGALASLRARIASLGIGSTEDKRVKVFVDRNSARRRVTNRDAVVAYFSDAGYVITQPEQIPLNDQIDLFSKASVIVGQTGAGLANMLFAPKGANIIVLSGNPEDPGPHSYFPNLARALGHEMDYIAFGPPTADLHIDFEVGMESLDRLRVLL